MAEAPPPSASGGHGIVATLRVPSFGAFWVASLFYFIVFGTQTFAFAWLVLELSDSASQSALVVFSLGIPALFVSLPAGVLFDRLDRRRLIMLASASGGVVMLAMALVISSGAMSVPLAVLFALSVGVAFGVNLPGIQAVVPSLVPPERLLSAISLQTMGMTTGLALGAALGGLVISQYGIAEAFFMQAALLFLSALLMLGPVFALVPDVARSKLGQGADTAGLLFAVTGVGAFGISLGLAAVGRLRRMGLVFLVTVVTGGFFLIAMGLSEVYIVTAAIMFGWGMAGGFIANTSRALIQSRTPARMMGRVIAFYALAFGAARPLGSLLAAPLAAWLGSDGGLIFSGALLIAIATLFLATQRELREME